MSYSEDAPDITNDTDPEELIEYVRKRVENPIEIDGVTIYHFNSHEIDREALERAVDEKLRRDTYQIPLQVHSGLAFIQSILPQRIREAELLVYREDRGEFFAYKNLIRELPLESQYTVQQELAGVIRSND